MLHNAFIFLNIQERFVKSTTLTHLLDMCDGAEDVLPFEDWHFSLMLHDKSVLSPYGICLFSGCIKF